MKRKLFKRPFAFRLFSELREEKEEGEGEGEREGEGEGEREGEGEGEGERELPSACDGEEGEEEGEREGEREREREISLSPLFIFCKKPFPNENNKSFFKIVSYPTHSCAIN